MLWETSWYLLIAPHWRWCLLQWELKLIPSIQYNTGGFTGTNGTILQYMIYMYIYSTYGNMRQRPSVSAWQGAQKNPKELPQQSVFLSPSSPIQAPGLSRETWRVWTLTCCPTSSALPWYGHVETNYNYRLRRVLHMSEPTAECSTHLLRRAPAHDIARRTPHVLDRYVYAYVCI